MFPEAAERDFTAEARQEQYTLQPSQPGNITGRPNHWELRIVLASLSNADFTLMTPFESGRTLFTRKLALNFIVSGDGSEPCRATVQIDFQRQSDLLRELSGQIGLPRRADSDFMRTRRH